MMKAIIPLFSPVLWQVDNLFKTEISILKHIAEFTAILWYWFCMTGNIEGFLELNLYLQVKSTIQTKVNNIILLDLVKRDRILKNNNFIGFISLLKLILKNLKLILDTKI